MSGCPIIQDDKIVGAVTHVFIDDPSCGYGIFIENMLPDWLDGMIMSNHVEWCDKYILIISPSENIIKFDIKFFERRAEKWDV